MHFTDPLLGGRAGHRSPLGRLMCVIGWCFTVAPAAALAATDETDRRRLITLERNQADTALEQRRLQCRQRFVVTACIDDARAEHRETVDKLDREEAALDSKLRHERAARRLAIIREKTDALARLSPSLPPSSSPTPAPAPSPSSAPGPSSIAPASRSTETSESALQAARREADSAAAERAASQRAAAAQQRRGEAARRNAAREAKRGDQQKASPGLPERPPLPPARMPSVPSN